jgi:hypothetical protein
MKKYLFLGALCLVFLIAGYVIGLRYATEYPVLVTTDNTKERDVTSVIDEATPMPTGKLSIQPNCDSNMGNSDIQVIGAQLTDLDPSVRLNALFCLWRNHSIDNYREEISQLAYADPDLQVSALAEWVLGISVDLESSDIAQAKYQITDYEDPDEEISKSLVENTNQFQQINELVSEEENLLEPIDQLSEDEQLAYIKKLTERQEDSAVNALAELIAHHNPVVQSGAIEGLLSLLKMRTGHFNTIAQSLEQNSVFLTYEQLGRLQELTQHNEDI